MKMKIKTTYVNNGGLDKATVIAWMNTVRGAASVQARAGIAPSTFLQDINYGLAAVTSTADLTSSGLFSSSLSTR